MNYLDKLEKANNMSSMPNFLVITVYIKDVYGKPLVYPVCSKAQLFAQLTNSKTFTPQAIDTIKNLGYAINVQQRKAL